MASFCVRNWRFCSQLMEQNNGEVSFFGFSFLKNKDCQSEWLFSWGVPCLIRWPFWKCVYPQMGGAYDCVQLYTVGQSSSRFVLEWHYLCEKLSTFGNLRYFHLWWEIITSNEMFRSSNTVFGWKLRHIWSLCFAWKSKELGRKGFLQLCLQRLSP